MITTGIIAGLIAGAIMGIISQFGYLLRILHSNLIVVDGIFAQRILNRDEGAGSVYFFGIIIHLITSLIFGIIYVVIGHYLDFELRKAVPLVIYVFVLWLVMLVVALPVAGQGLFGREIRGPVWFEQLLLHIIFGFSFWWALGLF